MSLAPCSSNASASLEGDNSSGFEDGDSEAMFASEVIINDIDKISLYFLDQCFPITINRDKLTQVFKRLPELRFKLTVTERDHRLPTSLTFRSKVSVAGLEARLQEDANADNKFSRHFDGNFYYDYTERESLPQITQGGQPLHHPYGCQFFAFKCKDKYENNDWLGANQESNAWPRAFHGTTAENVQRILEHSEGELKPGPRAAYGVGVYMSPDPAVAKSYATPYKYRDKYYRAVLMVHPKPGCFERVARSSGSRQEGAYWLVRNPTEKIRLVGLCIYASTRSEFDSAGRFALPPPPHISLPFIGGPTTSGMPMPPGAAPSGPIPALSSSVPSGQLPQQQPSTSSSSSVSMAYLNGTLSAVAPHRHVPYPTSRPPPLQPFTPSSSSTAVPSSLSPSSAYKQHLAQLYTQRQQLRKLMCQQQQQQQQLGHIAQMQQHQYLAQQQQQQQQYLAQQLQLQFQLAHAQYPLPQQQQQMPSTSSASSSSSSSSQSQQQQQQGSQQPTGFLDPITGLYLEQQPF